MNDLIEKEINSKGYEIDRRSYPINENVHKVIHTESKETFIIKIGNNENIRRERKILSEIKVDNISEIEESWNNDTHTFIVLKYIDGENLFFYLDEHDSISEDAIANIVRKLIIILTNLQKNNVHYCDLKLENIIILENEIYLIDFDIISLDKETSSDTGTDRYSSPEKIAKTKHSIEKANAWSLGIIMYMLFERIYPFYCNDNEEVDKSRLEGKYEEIKREISTELKDLLNKLFEVDPVKRLDYQGITKHPFITK